MNGDDELRIGVNFLTEDGHEDLMLEIWAQDQPDTDIIPPRPLIDAIDVSLEFWYAMVDQKSDLEDVQVVVDLLDKLASQISSRSDDIKSRLAEACHRNATDTRSKTSK